MAAPQGGFALSEIHKLQISNHKYQTIFNDRNSKFQTIFRPEGFWSLNIEICNLFGICDFRHKTPRQSHISLTPAMRGSAHPEYVQNNLKRSIDR